MANIIRSPFYVPRPSDDPSWQWVCPGSVAMRILSSQKVFGAGGQPPTKRWSPIYTFDDPAVWYEPTFQNGPVRVTLTQTKFYGQNGQTVTHNWAQNYTNDNPAVWSGSPLVSNIIHPLLTAAGQVRSRQWLFGLDDSAVWSGSPISSDTIHPLLTAAGQVKSKQWSYTFDDPSPWQPWINRDSIVLKITVSPFVNYIWQFTTDDAAPWQYTYQRSTLTPNTFGFNLRWRFNFVDDPPSWSPTLENLNSAAMQILSSGGQPHTKQPRFDTDDPGAWYFTIHRNQPVLTTSGTPTTSRQPTFATDDQPAWQWTPPNTITNQLATFTLPGINFPEGDDAPFWSWSTPPRPLTLTPSIATPFSPRFIPTFDEPPGWTGGLRPTPLTLTATAPTPFTPHQWLFNQDDATVWNAQSRNAFFTQTFPVSFTSSMWNLNIPQDTPMPIYSTSSAALYIPAPTASTLIQRTLTGVGL